MQVSATSGSSSYSSQIKSAKAPEPKDNEAKETKPDSESAPDAGAVAAKMQKLEVVNADENMLVMSNMYNVPTDMSGTQKQGKVNRYV